MQSLFSSQSQQNVKIASVDAQAHSVKKSGKNDIRDHFADVFASMRDEKPADVQPRHENEKPKAISAEAPVRKNATPRKKDERVEKADKRDEEKASCVKKAEKDETPRKCDDAQEASATDKQDSSDKPDNKTSEASTAETKKEPVKTGKELKSATDAGAANNTQKSELDSSATLADSEDATPEAKEELPPALLALLQGLNPRTDIKKETTPDTKMPEGLSRAAENLQKHMAANRAGFCPDAEKGDAQEPAEETATNGQGETPVDATAVKASALNATLTTPAATATQNAAKATTEGGESKKIQAVARDADEKMAERAEADGVDKNQRAETIDSAVKETRARREDSREHSADKKAAQNDAQKFAPNVNMISHPAAGSRAIAEAVQTAPGSHAPSPNGSSGGGSPLKVDTTTTTTPATTAATQGLAHTGASESTHFASFVKAAKESAPSSPAEQVAVHVFRAVKEGTNRFDIELHPADLGKVDIRLEIGKDGMVRAMLTADNQSTLDLLRKDSSALTSTLEQAGLQTDAGSLSFNLRGGESQGQQESAFARSHGAAKWMEKFKTPAAEEIPETIYYRAGTEGRVDLRV